MRFYSCFLHVPSKLDKTCYKRCPQKIYQVILSFEKIRTVKVALQLMAEMNFYLYFPYLLSELGEILVRGCAHNAVEHV
jgi:hypothetical protein